MEAPRKVEWQPIETAPKDGTPVLVHDEGAIEIATWDSDSDAWRDCSGHKMWPSPQHWMPLPDPPAPREEKP